MVVKNAKITKVDVMKETKDSMPYVVLTLEGFGWGCNFRADEYTDILHILNVFDVNNLSALNNSYCRVLIHDQIVRDIGHILEDSLTGDRWLRHWLFESNSKEKDTSKCSSCKYYNPSETKCDKLDLLTLNPEESHSCVAYESY